jgi:lipopolysaccharide transport system ATP-binding protein
VDEVLAVGDAAFQAKSLGKMEEVSGEGRTVLFVSHNMASIGKLCPTSMLLDEGKLAFSGESGEAIDRYLQSVFDESEAVAVFSEDAIKIMSIESIRVLDHNDNPAISLNRARPFRIEIKYQVREPINDACVSMTLSTRDNSVRICNSRDTEMSTDGFIERQPGRYTSVVEFPGGILNNGAYYARVGLYSPRTSTIDSRNSPAFELIDHGDLANYQTALPESKRGMLAFPLKWSTELVDSSRDQVAL